MFASRAVRIVAFVAGTAVAGQALGATPAIVVDADSGKVLHAERATDPWFPASITKLMTTYVALDLVRQGRARMDQLLTMSESAAANPPSKMGFKPGTQLTLENALKIIMVKSANDVAAMLGENLGGGSVEDFSALMNDAAQRLGMSESNWANPHGLPDPRQKTSARDMAILAQALIREFPDRADLFKIGAIRFGRIVMRNHNGLLGRYPGVDGMKTGFICASGFNVVTSATQNGRRLITVVLGGTTANERNLRAADLLDRGFAASGGWGVQTAQQLPASNLIAPPDMRPVVCDRRGPLPAEEEGTGTVSAGNVNDNSTPPTLAFAGGSPAPARTTLGPRASFEPVRVWLGPTPPAATETAESKPTGPKSAEKAAGARPARPERKQIAARPEPKPVKPAPKAAAKPAGSSEAFASTAPASPVMDDGKAKPRAVTPADALKPAKAGIAKSAAKKPVAKKPEAKPTRAAQAKPAPSKAAAKPQAKKPAPKAREADDE